MEEKKYGTEEEFIWVTPFDKRTRTKEDRLAFKKQKAERVLRRGKFRKSIKGLGLTPVFRSNISWREDFLVRLFGKIGYIQVSFGWTDYVMTYSQVGKKAYVIGYHISPGFHYNCRCMGVLA